MRKLAISLSLVLSLAGTQAALAEIAIGADFQAAIAIVRCPRSEMPAKEDLIAKAERSL